MGFDLYYYYLKLPTHFTTKVHCTYKRHTPIHSFTRIQTCGIVNCIFMYKEQPLMVQCVYFHFNNFLFIALIHPIQWTIAYPVGADRPAKRQKKTSCVSTGQAGPVLCTRQVACSTSFLSRQRDVIASFSFGACPVYTKI